MRKRSHAIAVIGAVAALGLCFTEYRSQRQTQQWVNHSVQVLTAIQETRSQLVDARNQYDLYMDGGTISAYRDRLQALAENIDRLQILTADNAAQQKHLSEYRALVTFQPNNPKRQIFTDYQRRLFVRISQDEINLLQMRQSQAEDTLRLLNLLTIAFFAVAAVATVHALREYSQRERAARLLEVSQRALTKRTAQLEAIVSVIPAAVLIRDRDGVCLEVLSDGAGLRLAREMVSRTPFEVTSITVATQIMEAITAALKDQKTVKLDYQATAADGRLIWFETSVSAIDQETVLVIASDATEEHQQTARLIALATTDPLTGLANRRYFVETVNNEIAYQLRDWNSLKVFALCLIDLDEFKQINAVYSHSGGDAVLCAIADILKTETRRTDFPARTGGDEMALLVKDVALEGAIVVAEKIRSAVKHAIIPYQHNGIWIQIRVTVTIGIALYSADCNTFELLLRTASECLLEGKNESRDRVYAARC